MDGGCPWSWHGLQCACEFGHGSPHQLICEQPQMAAIDAAYEKVVEVNARMQDFVANCDAAILDAFWFMENNRPENKRVFDGKQ